MVYACKVFDEMSPKLETNSFWIGPCLIFKLALDFEFLANVRKSIHLCTCLVLELYNQLFHLSKIDCIISEFVIWLCEFCSLVVSYFIFALVSVPLS